MEKLRPSAFKLAIYAVVAFLIIGTIVFISFFSLFVTFPWEPIVYFFIIAIPSLVLLFFFLSLKYYYYVIEKKFFVVRKFNKEYYYNYDDIIYIDTHRKSPKKAIAFYTNKNDVRYLTTDKNDVLYKTLLNKCKNLLTDDEFRIRYPNVKI